ncbi:WW domain-binding protein 11-like [Elephas maximus indicus]|uniref:WW domain-binding protein 11-like n=1 Tax=Elephas maximus indicus TaxID=99487 RepID=UPI0021172B55|nr:WW domain-binding protein 11-like [Elephas maximus indicus]
MTPCKLCPWIKLLSHGILQEDEPGVPGEGERFGNLQRSESPAAGCPHHGAKGDRASLFPLGALGRLEVYDQAGNPRDSRLEARRRDSDRGSREEEPEVAAGGSGPSEGRAKGCSGPGRRREVGVTPVWKVCASQAGAAACLHLPGTTQGAEAEAEGRGLQSRPQSGTRTSRVGRRASAPRSRACCPRVLPPRAPSPERGRQGGGCGPWKVSGAGPAAREPCAGSCAPVNPVRRPDVLRINKMKLRATGGQIAPGPPSVPPQKALDLPPHPYPAAAPPPGPNPRGKLQPRRAPARPRPLAGPGALCRSH